MRVTRERVRIEVGGRPLGHSADELLHSQETPSLGGFGLQIVERMADTWGIEPPPHTAIWFELAR